MLMPILSKHFSLKQAQQERSSLELHQRNQINSESIHLRKYIIVRDLCVDFKHLFYHCRAQSTGSTAGAQRRKIKATRRLQPR